MTQMNLGNTYRHTRGTREWNGAAGGSGRRAKSQKGQ